LQASEESPTEEKTSDDLLWFGEIWVIVMSDLLRESKFSERGYWVSGDDRFDPAKPV
jgi:hypothetical protein